MGLKRTRLVVMMMMMMITNYLTWHKVLVLQGHVTVMWDHVVVSTVRRL